jgi:hypothetical protein
MNPAEKKHIADIIRRYGVLVMGVAPAAGDTCDVCFCYTIGNAGHGLPELLLVGAATWNKLLTELSDLQRERGLAFAHGELVDLGGAYPIKIVRPDAEVARRHFTCLAGQFYGDETYEVRQLVLCDTQGLYPEDAQCAPPYSEQLDLASIATRLQH